MSLRRTVNTHTHTHNRVLFTFKNRIIESPIFCETYMISVEKIPIKIDLTPGGVCSAPS